MTALARLPAWLAVAALAWFVAGIPLAEIFRLRSDMALLLEKMPDAERRAAAAEAARRRLAALDGRIAAVAGGSEPDLPATRRLVDALAGAGADLVAIDAGEAPGPRPSFAAVTLDADVAADRFEAVVGTLEAIPFFLLDRIEARRIGAADGPATRLRVTLAGRYLVTAGAPGR